MTEDKFWDINSLMENIPLKKSTIYSMVSRKKIPYKKIGKKLIFNKKDINNWINNGGKTETIEEDFPILNI
ncbi:helix-turn-helix transcriptional regulator [Chryseobacterium shandongense]|uniref:helix-turn-helix transcriptional regulator n=1 Tax=Chryseobacterium shandongense TaxID=1493872 RepID=UPI000F4F0ABE|nr:helix-turn-helix domain-containing protein [Chryseobacterium shandongense]AZA58601.1 DNA-binding protein [Chryseobacterium shandongense]